MLEEALIWFWALWGLVFLGFLVWGLWVLLWDEPRRRRQVLRRLETVTRPPGRP